MCRRRSVLWARHPDASIPSSEQDRSSHPAWANMDKALLAHSESGPEWVERIDPLAREARLLDEGARLP